MDRRYRIIELHGAHAARAPAWLAIAGLAIFLLLIFAPSSNAGTYEVHACGPGGLSPAWQQRIYDGTPDDAVDFSSDCSSGAALSVKLDKSIALQHGQGGAWAFDAPAGTSIAGAGGSFDALVDYPYQVGSRRTAGIRSIFPGGDVDVEGCVYVWVDCHETGAVPSLSPLTSFELTASCNDFKPGCLAAGHDHSGDDQEPGPGVEARASLADPVIELDDPQSPSFTNLGGTLPNSSGAGGERTVTVDLSDAGGGVASLALSVDGGEPNAAAPGGSCVEPYALSVPCPGIWQHSFSVDTTGFTLGEHSLVLTATDASGNTSQFGPVGFVVTDGSGEPPNNPPTGGGGGPVIDLGDPAPPAVITFAKRVVEARRSGTVHVTGHVTTPTGAPLGGARLSASTIDIADLDADSVVLPAVTTASDGSFDVPVKALGAKRLTLTYLPGGNAGQAAASMLVRQSLTLSIRRSKPRLRAGGRLTISGVLGGAGGAHKGAPVEIDALVRGRWRAVAVVKASSRGKYSWRYRFTRVTRPTIFRFRAVVRKTSAWPWPSEFSSTVKVQVNG